MVAVTTKCGLFYRGGPDTFPFLDAFPFPPSPYREEYCQWKIHNSNSSPWGEWDVRTTIRPSSSWAACSREQPSLASWQRCCCCVVGDGSDRAFPLRALPLGSARWSLPHMSA